ncbi:hypothetical protein GW17_00050136 [Ensete ventricosum]|nr:hypothetical protein GW17_00050136 [Ensete ventricosum]
MAAAVEAIDSDDCGKTKGATGGYMGAMVAQATTKWVRLMESEEGAPATVIEEEEDIDGKQSSRGGAKGGVARCDKRGRGRGALGRGGTVRGEDEKVGMEGKEVGVRALKIDGGEEAALVLAR